MLRLNECLQIGQAALPKHAVAVQPGIDGAQRGGIEFVNTVATGTMLADEPSAAEQAQVFRFRWARNGEGLGDSAGGERVLPQQIENSAPRGIRESAESSVW